MNIDQIREIAQITMRTRAHKAVYLSGAIDRIVAAAKGMKRRLGRDLTTEEAAEMLCGAIEAEERHPDRDAALFDAMALPGWQEWARHAEAIR